MAIRAERGIGLGAREAAFRHLLVERFGDAALRGVAGAEARVVQLDAMAVERGDLRDAGAHRSRADHGDDGILRQRVVMPALRKAFIASGEMRRPLGGERGHPFPIVLAVAELALQVALEIELRRQRVAGGRLQRLLDRGETPRGRLRQVGQELLRDGRQLGVLDALPDEPPLRGLLRRQLVAEEREAERARVADEARQEVRAAGSRERDPACRMPG